MLTSLSFFVNRGKMKKDLIIGVGEPGMGKTKAGNVSLATTGSYPKRFYDLFTYAHNGSVSSLTTIEFQAEDPTDP